VTYCAPLERFSAIAASDWCRPYITSVYHIRLSKSVRKLTLGLRLRPRRICHLTIDSGRCAVPMFLRFIRKLRLPKCSICDEPVELETAKTDEDGKPVHEDCYIRRTRLKEITPPPKAS
jgi:hypothetical protein